MQSAHNTAILLAAFGSRLPDASQALERMREHTAALYPDFRVETALTSGTVRRHKGLASRHGRSPEEILKALRKDGVTRLAVQSLHVIPGDEFRSLERMVESLRGGPGHPGGFEQIELGRPLLGNREDIRRVALTILTVLPPERAPGEAVLLMGHGTSHPANAAYAALQLALWKRDKSVFIATVEDTPGLDDVLPELKRQGIRKVFLVPLMSVAGDHARNDMAGKENDSWASKLTAAGIKSEAVLVGLGSRPAVAGLWIDHLRDAVKELDH